MASVVQFEDFINFRGWKIVVLNMKVDRSSGRWSMWRLEREDDVGWPEEEGYCKYLKRRSPVAESLVYCYPVTAGSAGDAGGTG